MAQVVRKNEANSWAIRDISTQNLGDLVRDKIIYDLILNPWRHYGAVE